MSDDESLLPDYRKALTSIKGRCPIPPRIEWIAEQAAREAIKSIDSYGGAGQQPPAVPELCATSVTYRGKSEGYDMRVWGAGAKGREQPVTASTQSSAPASASEATPVSNNRPFSGSKAEIGKVVDEALWGKLGSWECSIWKNRQFQKAAEIVRMRIEPDGPSTHMEVFIYGRGQPFVSRIYRGGGDYQGSGQAFPHLKIDMQGAEVGRDGANAYFITEFAHDVAVYGENSSRHIGPGSGTMQCVSSTKLRS